MFQECNELTNLDLSNFNTSKVENMSKMFSDCYELEFLDLSNFNTSGVTDMESMFNKCYKLKEIKGINNFNMSNVINRKEMFEDCYELKNLDLNKFNFLNNNIDIKDQSNINSNDNKYLGNKKEKNSDKKKIDESSETPKQLVNLITVYFMSTDQNINCAISCYNTDHFITLEGKLYLKFPELKNKVPIFLCNGRVINKSDSLAKNGIKNDNHILINYNN